MEFVNSSLKKGKSPRGGGNKYENGARNGRPHPQAQHQFNAAQYKQFVSNAIALGRNGQNGGGHSGYGHLGLMQIPNNGILQALQAQGQGQGFLLPTPVVSSTSGSLGGLFQELTLEKNNSSRASKERKVKKDKNGGGGHSGYQNQGGDANGHKNGAAAASAKKIHNQIPVQQPESHEAMTKRLNNEALLRMDPAFKGLFGNASQVAVYDYDAVTKDWVS